MTGGVVSATTEAATQAGAVGVADIGDGCTGWPDMTWRACCDAHDLAYAAQAPKLQADWALFTCVAPHDPIAAAIMFAGVVAFGWLWYLRARARSSPRS